MIKTLFGRTSFHLALISLVSILVYSNTLNAPFQWDEKELIKDNPIIKDVGYFVEPSKAQGLEYYEAFKRRYVGYLTFALNFRLHGLDVRGYHLFNIAVHLINALLVYALVNLTLRTPFLRGSYLGARSGWSALFTALLFATHPVQTEAVTYIFQRLASLAAMFYLGSIVLYAKWRGSQTPVSGRHPALYLLSLLCAVLAMKTKENAFTLPIMITVFEYFFFPGGRFRPHLIPFVLTLFIIPLSVGQAWNIPAQSHEGAVITRGDYLLTQLSVAVTYIRLLLLPVNQNIDYDYPLYKSFFNLRVLTSFMLILLLLTSAYILLILSKRKKELRPVAFGILWFYITLSVESSVIPLPMLIDEYRIYLPSFGAILSFVTALSLIYDRLKGRARVTAVGLILAVPVILSFAAYERNKVWRSEIRLWQDVVRKSPQKARGHFNLAVAYMSEDLADEAIAHYKAAIRLRPDYAKAHINLGIAYRKVGKTDLAIAEYMAALRGDHNNAELHNNIGNAYDDKGMFDLAIEHYKYAIQLRPDYGAAHYNVAIAYRTKGLSDKADEHYRIAEKLGFNR